MTVAEKQYPHKQPFQLAGRPNKKANAWYKRGKSNNASKKRGE